MSAQTVFKKEVHLNFVLLAQITEQLNNLKSIDEDLISWAEVGDAAWLNSKLNEIKEFMARNEIKDVSKYIMETKA